jgi:hypothetical protein
VHRVAIFVKSGARKYDTDARANAGTARNINVRTSGGHVRGVGKRSNFVAATVTRTPIENFPNGFAGEQGKAFPRPVREQTIALILLP